MRYSDRWEARAFHKDGCMKGIKGKLVQVEFWDHCIEEQGAKSKGLMKFKVWGRVEKYNDHEIVIRQWELQTGDKATKKHNNEVAKILVPSIIDIRFLEVLPELQIEGH